MYFTVGVTLSASVSLLVAIGLNTVGIRVSRTKWLLVSTMTAD